MLALSLAIALVVHADPAPPQGKPAGFAICRNAPWKETDVPKAIRRGGPEAVAAWLKAVNEKCLGTAAQPDAGVAPPAPRAR